METKICTNCNEEKNISEFYNNKRVGKNKRCKKCDDKQNLINKNKRFNNCEIQSLSGEVWKPITDFERYQISNYGRVLSISKKGYKKILNGYRRKDGYITFSLYKNKIPNDFLGHVLVADYFIERIPDKNYINHIDCNPSNNFYKNLERCTQSENIIHAFSHGLCSQIGESHYNNKLSKKDVLYIINSKESQTALAKKFRVSRSAIHDIQYGITWKHITAT